MSLVIIELAFLNVWCGHVCRVMWAMEDWSIAWQKLCAWKVVNAEIEQLDEIHEATKNKSKEQNFYSKNWFLRQASLQIFIAIFDRKEAFLFNSDGMFLPTGLHPSHNSSVPHSCTTFPDSPSTLYWSYWLPGSVLQRPFSSSSKIYRSVYHISYSDKSHWTKQSYWGHHHQSVQVVRGLQLKSLTKSIHHAIYTFALQMEFVWTFQKLKP